MTVLSLRPCPGLPGPDAAGERTGLQAELHINEAEFGERCHVSFGRATLEVAPKPGRRAKSCCARASRETPGYSKTGGILNWASSTSGAFRRSASVVRPGSGWLGAGASARTRRRPSAGRGLCPTPAAWQCNRGRGTAVRVPALLLRVQLEASQLRDVVHLFNRQRHAKIISARSFTPSSRGGGRIGRRQHVPGQQSPPSTTPDTAPCAPASSDRYDRPSSGATREAPRKW